MCLNSKKEAMANEPETSAATGKVQEGTVWPRMSVPFG